MRWHLLLAALLSLCAAAPAAAQPSVAPSMEELRARAESGDADAQFDLAIQLLMTNQEANLAEARRWLRAATDAGNVEAKNVYAGLLINGGGGPRDEEEGRRLLLEAASEGSVGANWTLAAAYREGRGGFERDPARAFSHMRAAAERAEGESAARLYWELGMMHLRGVGTPPDAAVAYRWVSRAADAGSIDGMISRGVMLATGEGVAEDDAEARRWYGRAAHSGRQGYAHALRALGAMLVSGEGGPVDLPRGFAYLFIAHAAEEEHAQRIIDMFADRLTPEIESEALRIAQSWVAEHLPGE